MNNVKNLITLERDHRIKKNMNQSITLKDIKNMKDVNKKDMVSVDLIGF
jgi:hypothetical protein